MADTLFFVNAETLDRKSTKVAVGLVDTGDVANGQPVYAMRVSGGVANYYTQAESDARYGQLATVNTWSLAQTFTGQVLASAGAVGAPSLSFALDPNTGIYNGAADVVNVATGGVMRLSVNTSGIFVNGAVNSSSNNVSIVDAAVTAPTDAIAVYHDSTGTPQVGFGSRVAFALKSSTTNTQAAGGFDVLWAVATHASRTSKFAIRTVYNAGSTTETLAAQRTGVAASTGLWLYDEDNATLEQVTVGAADSGGAGFKLLRIAN